MPGEHSRLEELQSALDALLLDEPSQAPSRHHDPQKRNRQPLPCVVEEWTRSNDVVPGLQDGGVVVILTFVARTKEE